VLAAVVFVELGWRLWSGVFVLSIDNLIARELSPLQWANGPYVYDDRLGWRLKPRFQGAGQGRPDGKLTIGAFGLRGLTNNARQVSGGGVLAVGETATIGSDIDDSETWPARLSILLQEPVLNGSAWSWGLDQIVLRAEELVPILHPSALLLATTPQSVAETNYKTYHLGYKPYFDVADGKLVLEGVPVPKRSARARDIGGPQSVLGYSHVVNSLMRTSVGSWISNFTSGTDWVSGTRLYQPAHAKDQSREIACLLMEQLADLKRRYGTRVLVIMQYSANELLTPRASQSQPTLDCAQERGLEVFDSYQPLHMLAESDPATFRRLWRRQGDSYGPPSAEGNNYLAALIGKALAASKASQ
jgi:hypothetical protein